MTKREVVKEAWEIATGCTPYTVATVYQKGRGWQIDASIGYSIAPLYHPLDERGQPEYMIIRHEGRWDTEDHQATQAEIKEYLFGDYSPL